MISKILGLLGAMLIAAPTQAQDREQHPPSGVRWSVGAGASFITGTPHRPRPPAGEGLTGASGPELGIHVRVSAERLVGRWLLAGVEGSYNRLTTSTMTLNCIEDVDSENTGTCYPAAGLDEVVGLFATLRAEPARRLAPFVTLGAGAGAFRLTVDEPFEGSENLDDRSGIRPVMRLGTGITYEWGNYRLSLEGSFNATIGRGGGTHHIPLVLSVSF